MFKIKDNLDIVAYGAAVREIADKFFDSDGNYAPHIGKANAMVVFYNYFVIESKFSEMTPEEFTTDLFFTDEEFLSEYNKAIKLGLIPRFKRKKTMLRKLYPSYHRYDLMFINYNEIKNQVSGPDGQNTDDDV